MQAILKQQRLQLWSGALRTDVYDHVQSNGCVDVVWKKGSTGRLAPRFGENKDTILDTTPKT